jgi:hypothetical protein
LYGKEYGKDQKESLEIDISAKEGQGLEQPLKVKIPTAPITGVKYDGGGNTLFEQGFAAGQKELLTRIEEANAGSKNRQIEFIELTSEIISSIKELKQTLIHEFETICKQEIPNLTVDVLRKIEKNEPIQFREMITSFMQSMAMEDISIRCSPQVFDVLSEGSQKRFDPILVLEDQFEGHRMEIKFA